MAVQAKGKVKRLYPTYETTKGKTFIRLELPGSAVAPKDGYFFIDTSHPNYNALYSLALAAAVNRYELTVRTAEDISNQDYAKVLYMVVDW